ncbi:MAG: hypothetical protein AAGN35_19665 [Bacteroidota bacterium]
MEKLPPNEYKFNPTNLSNPGWPGWYQEQVDSDPDNTTDFTNPAMDLFPTAGLFRPTSSNSTVTEDEEQEDLMDNEKNPLIRDSTTSGGPNEIKNLLDNPEKGSTTEILSILFTLTNGEITTIFRQDLGEEKTIDFLESLKVHHFIRFPREIAFAAQGLSVQKRRDMVIKKLEKNQKHITKSKTGKYKKEAAQIIFLAQGLSQEEIAKKRKTNLLTQVFADNDEFVEALRSDLTADNQQQAEQGAEFTVYRKDLYKRINQAEKELEKLRKKWNRPKEVMGFSPEQAVNIFEKLRGLDDVVRNEIIRRHPEQIFYLNLNVPATYRGQIDFGMDSSRGFPPDLVEPEENKDQVPREGASLFSVIAEIETNPEDWFADERAIRRFDLILSMAILGGKPGYTQFKELLQEQIERRPLWEYPTLVERMVFILTDGVTKAPNAQVQEKIRQIKAWDQERYIDWTSLGFAGDNWQMPPSAEPNLDFTFINAGRGVLRAQYDSRRRYAEARKGEKRAAKKAGQKFDRRAYRRDNPKTSNFFQLLLFAAGLRKDLNLLDYSLSGTRGKDKRKSLQNRMGGDLMGLELGQGSSEATSDVRIDAVIREGYAQVSSARIPFQQLDYESGTDITQFDNGYIHGLEAEFFWNSPTSSQSTGASAIPSVPQSCVTIDDLLINNFRLADATSTTGVGRISVQGLKITLNQPLETFGKVTGYGGLNLVQTISELLMEVISLTSSALLTAADPFAPDLGLGDGEALSGLLHQYFDSSLRLELNFEALSVENVFSDQGESIRAVSSGPGAIRIGGSMADHYREKADAIRDSGDPSVTAQAKASYYQQIADDKRVSQAQDKLMLGATLNDLRVEMVNERGKAEPMLVPTGQIDLATMLNTPTLNLDANARQNTLLRARLGILADEDQMPEATLNREHTYFEGTGLQLPQEHAIQSGMDINSVLPDWVGGQLKMNGDVWQIELRTPELIVQNFPQLEDYFFEQIRPEIPPTLTMADIIATLELHLIPEEERKERGLIIEKVMVPEVKGSTLKGENIRIFSEDLAVALNEDTYLEGFQFGGLGFFMDENYNVLEMVPGEMFLNSRNIGINGLTGQLGETLNAVLTNFTAKDFSFTRLHREAVDPSDPECREDFDRLTVAFTGAQGDGNSVTYTGEGELEKINQQISELDFELTSLSLTMEETSQHERFSVPDNEDKPKEEWRKSSSEVTYDLAFSIPSIAVPNLAYGEKGSPFQIKGIGGDEFNPVELQGVQANVTIHQDSIPKEADEKDPALFAMRTTDVMLNSLVIDQLRGNDIRVVFSGDTYDLGGRCQIDGLYAMGLDLGLVDGKDTHLRGSAGFNKSYIETLVTKFVTVRDTQTGRFGVERLASQDGYAYSLNNLLGEAERDGKNHKKETVKQFDATLFGEGLSASGRFMDNRRLTSRISLPGGIAVNRLNWYDDRGQYSTILPEGSEATLGAIKADIDLKLKQDGSNDLEYITFRSLSIDALNASRPQVLFNDNTLNFSDGESLDLINIQARNLNYKPSEKEFSGGLTIDRIIGTADVNYKSEVIQELRTRPSVSLNDFSFSMDKAGTVKVGFGMGSVGIPGQKTDATDSKDRYPTNIKTEGLGLQAGQFDDVINLLYFEKMEMVSQKIDAEKPKGEDNVVSTYKLVNAHLGPLVGALQESGEQPFIDQLELEGGLIGTLMVTDHPDYIELYTTGKDEYETGDSAIRFESGRVTLHDFNALLNREDDSREIIEPPEEEGYVPSDFYDVFYSLKPASEGGGVVRINLLGGTAELPIQSVPDPENPERMLGGYVDANALMEQLRDEIRAIIWDQTYGVANAVLEISDWAYSPSDLELRFERVGDAYTVKYGIITVENWAEPFYDLSFLTIAEQLGTRGLVESEGTELLSLAHLIDYQTNVPRPNDGESSTEPTTPIAIMNQIATVLLGEPFSIELENISIDLEDYQNKMSEELAPGETREVKLGDYFDVTTTSGKELGLNLTVSLNPAELEGPRVLIRDLRVPRYTFNFPLKSDSYSNLELSGDAVQIDRIEGNIEDLRRPETQLDATGIEFRDFYLKMNRRKTED